MEANHQDALSRIPPSGNLSTLPDNHLSGLLTGIISSEWQNPSTRKELERLGCDQYACVDLASDALYFGFMELGKPKLAKFFKNRKLGLQMQKDLVSAGWEGYYIVPTTNYTSLNQSAVSDLNYLNNKIIYSSSGRTKFYESVDSRGKVVKVPVKGAIYDYLLDSYQVSATPGSHADKAIRRLKSINFAVGTWGGGKHVWILLNETHYEVYYDYSYRNPYFFEERPSERVNWSQGLIVLPPSD